MSATPIGRWHGIWAAWTVGQLLFLALLAVLDLVAYRRDGNEATFSVWLRDLSRAWLIIPWALGGLTVGVAVHWYASMTRRLSEVPAADLLAELDRRADELGPIPMDLPGDGPIMVVGPDDPGPMSSGTPNHPSMP